MPVHRSLMQEGTMTNARDLILRLLALLTIVLVIAWAFPANTLGS